MHMKESKGSNPSAHLKRAIQYILDEGKEKSREKTKGGVLVGGNAGLTAEEVYETMMYTKIFYEKNWGRQGYHFVLSLKKGEGTAMDALELAEKFCRTYFGDTYDYVIAAHDDQDHKHSHVICAPIRGEFKSV